MTINRLFASASQSMETLPEADLQRLGLYQVFLRLYQHHRPLLDELLQLEFSAAKRFPGMMLPYIQGCVWNQEAFLLSNLLCGRTQQLLQPARVWTIGRDPQQVMLAIADQRLSRCHAAIWYESPHFYLADLNSSNGSFLNGEVVRQPVVLQDGDRIRLSSISFVFFRSQNQQVLPPISSALQAHLTQLGQSLEPPCSLSAPASAPNWLEVDPLAQERSRLPPAETLGFLQSGPDWID